MRRGHRPRLDAVGLSRRRVSSDRRKKGVHYAIVNRGPTEHDRLPEVSIRRESVGLIFPVAVESSLGGGAPTMVRFCFLAGLAVFVLSSGLLAACDSGGEVGSLRSEAFRRPTATGIASKFFGRQTPRFPIMLRQIAWKRIRHLRGAAGRSRGSILA